MKDIILAGISASGKGTQSKKLLEYFGEKMKYFETGDILRALQSSNNAIGNYLKDLTKNGILVKDEVVSGLFGVFLETLNEGDLVLGDGCMRKIDQTNSIVKQLKDRNRDFVVIEFTIPEKEVYERLMNRVICSNCGVSFNSSLYVNLEQCLQCGGKLFRRNDDVEISSIKNRIKAYNENIVPALDVLDKQRLLVKIDGMQTIDEIFKQILDIIKTD